MARPKSSEHPQLEALIQRRAAIGAVIRELENYQASHPSQKKEWAEVARPSTCRPRQLRRARLESPCKLYNLQIL
jgi:hypothetical protein